MATIMQEAEIVIPADYLEDVRSALVSEIENDGDMIRTNHEGVLEGTHSGREDRAASVRILREDMHLLDQVLDASGDTTLRGGGGALVHTLEGLIRQTVERLRSVAQYGPIPMGDVLDLTAELRWAGQESVRIEPTMSNRLNEDERKAL